MFRTIFAGAAFAVTLGLLTGCNRSPATTPTTEASPREDVPHEHVEMPDKLGTEEEKKVFLTPGGLYTEADIAAINSRIDKENSERSAEDKALSDRIDREIADRENAINQVGVITVVVF